MKWTLGHDNRRTFPLASSPTEKELIVGVAEDIAYKDVLNCAEQQLNIKTIYNWPQPDGARLRRYLAAVTRPDDTDKERHFSGVA